MRGRRARARQSRNHVSPSSSTVGTTPEVHWICRCCYNQHATRRRQQTTTNGSTTQSAVSGGDDETKVRCEAITKVGNRCQYTSCCDVVLDDGIKRGCVHHKTKSSFNKKIEEKRLLTAAKRELRKQRKQRIADEVASGTSSRDSTSHNVNSSGDDADGGGSKEQTSDKEYSKIVQVKRRKKKYYEATKYMCSVCGKSGHTRPTCPEIQIFLESRHLRKTLNQKIRNANVNRDKVRKMQASHLHQRDRQKTKTFWKRRKPVEKEGTTHVEASDANSQNVMPDNRAVMEGFLRPPIERMSRSSRIRQLIVRATSVLD